MNNLPLQVNGEESAAKQRQTSPGNQFQLDVRFPLMLTVEYFRCLLEDHPPLIALSVGWRALRRFLSRICIHCLAVCQYTRAAAAYLIKFRCNVGRGVGGGGIGGEKGRGMEIGEERDGWMRVDIENWDSGESKG